MKKDLYMGASAIADDNLYFYSDNACGLYRLNLISEEIKKITDMPCNQDCCIQFSSLVYYKDKIWMIPWFADFIYLYDLKNKKLAHLALPEDEGMQPGKDKFRRCVVIGKYIWLLPVYSHFLMRVDMEELSYHLYSNWPAGTELSCGGMNFKMMCPYKEKLYLFSGESNKNIVFDTKSKEMQIWNADVHGEFGVVAGENCYVSPNSEKSNIRILPICGRGVKTNKMDIELPKDIWIKEKIYAYWYTDFVNEKVYFLPHEADGILVWSVKDAMLDVVKVNSSDYNSLARWDSYSAYQCIGYGDKAVITPYAGNKLILLDKFNHICKEIALRVSDEKFGGLQGFIERVKLPNPQLEWKNEQIAPKNKREKTGEKIYAKLKSQMEVS